MDKAAACEILRSQGWLSRQPEPFRADVLRRCHLRRFQATDSLYHAGDSAAGVFGLVEGTIELYLPNGHVGTIKTPGYWVGETAAFRRAPRLASIVASTVSYVLYLPLAEFERLVASAEYCRYFAYLTIEHLEEALAVVADLMASGPMARVSGRLLSLSEAQADQARILPVTQAELASMCGLTRQTVNKVVKSLAKDGIVSTEYRQVTIRNRAGLERLARGTA